VAGRLFDGGSEVLEWAQYTMYFDIERNILKAITVKIASAKAAT